MIDDIEKASRALSSLLPGSEPVTWTRPLTTGFSNETYVIEGSNLILRLPPSAGAMVDGHGVIAQADIYRELDETAGAPPVPKIVLSCEDPQVLGVPFYVMECVEGEAIHDTQLQDWFTSASDDFRESICRQWVSAFAGLSHLQPLDVLGPVTSPEEDAKRWRQFAASANCPELVGQYDRLLAYAAPISGPPTVVHGDTKLSNLMWHEGQISAMLDWEMALNGEPLADLGYMLYGFESGYHGPTTPQKQPGMLSRSQVIALWEQVSGRSADGVFWHEIAQIGKITAIIAEGTNMWLTGRSKDPKLEYFAKNLGYYLGVMEAMLNGGGF